MLLVEEKATKKRYAMKVISVLGKHSAEYQMEVEIMKSIISLASGLTCLRFRLVLLYA